MPTTHTGYSARQAYVLVLLTLVYAFNIADRFVVSTILEPIRLDLGLTDASIALVTGVALALFYVSIGLPVAQYADRANRRNIVAGSVVLWSLMTAACGQVQNTVQFVLARFVVNEPFGWAHYVTFAFVWVALAIFTLGPRFAPRRVPAGI